MVGVGDVFETRSATGGQGPIEAARALPATDRAKFQGNLVWQALKRRGASGSRKATRKCVTAGSEVLIMSKLDTTCSVR